MGEWFQTIITQFDDTILRAVHEFAVATGGNLTWLMTLVSALAHSAIGMFALGLVLMCFRRTRRVGICVFGAVCCGALITNLFLKPIVARTRPYDASELYRAWNAFVGAAGEHDYSFPSGHTTATMAAMTGLFLTTKKSRSWTAFLLVALMGFSRIYLVVHYPTDVLGGIVCGAIGAVAAYFITKLIWRTATTHADSKFWHFVLTFDPIVALFHRVFRKKTTEE